LEHPNDSVAIYAASGLVRIGAEPDRTMSALIQQARSDRGNRYMFARMVAEFGDQARPHLPELIELVSAPADGTRLGGVLAIRALAEIAAFDLRPALPALRACLGPQTSPKLSQAVSEAILLIERMYPEMGPTP
jgi:hypothetical protein